MHFREPERQAPGLAARANQDTANVSRGTNRGRLPAATAAARRQAFDAAFATHADVGGRCHELRVGDANVTWRILYRIDADAIVIAEVFGKKSRTTPQSVIENCRKRLKEYDDASSEA